MKIVLEDDGIHTQGEFRVGDEPEALPLAKVDSKVLTRALMAPRKPIIGLLPPAVRWISPEKDFVVFERPPCYKTLILSMAQMSEAHMVDDETYTIAIPWQVYHVQFTQGFVPHKIRAFLRPEPLQSLDDELWILPMLNFYTNAVLCNPVHGAYEYYEPTLANGINAAYNMVWNSGFNLDLREALLQITSQKKPFRLHNLHHNANRLIRTIMHEWSKMTLQEAVEASWPSPSVLMASEPEGKVHLRTIFELSNTEAQLEIAQNFPSRFMINIINTMSANTL